MENKPIYVTRPLLPDLGTFIPLLERIWESQILTNGGPFHQLLEQQLKEYLGVSDISLFTNGALALISAMQSMDLAGEVITTPYSFVATAHTIAWNRLKPVFVDVEPGTLNMDPARIEAAITPETSAILPVHCYGAYLRCPGRSRDIADRHGLKVIYDAAHAFGVRDAGGSVLRHGDLSILSFHATKVFNTFEGGGRHLPRCPDPAAPGPAQEFRLSSMSSRLAEVGLNAKMSEIHAAFGLLSLKDIDSAISRRERVDSRYREALSRVEGIQIVKGGMETRHNFAYFPILVNDDYPLDRDGLYDRLKEHQIFARRYFYPLISDFAPYRDLPSSRPLQSAQRPPCGGTCPVPADLLDPGRGGAAESH